MKEAGSRGVAIRAAVGAGRRRMRRAERRRSLPLEHLALHQEGGLVPHKRVDGAGPVPEFQGSAADRGDMGGHSAEQRAKRAETAIEREQGIACLTGLACHSGAPTACSAGQDLF